MAMMYIDDDAANREVLGQMLGIGEVEMTAAPDVRTGLALLDQSHFELLLVDLHMPEVSGLTAIRRIRARGDHKARTPILVVTAHLTSGVEAMCRAAGADGFVTKPVDMGQLFSRIGEVLAHRDGTLVN